MTKMLLIMVIIFNFIKSFTLHQAYTFVLYIQAFVLYIDFVNSWFELVYFTLGAQYAYIQL